MQENKINISYRFVFDYITNNLRSFYPHATLIAVVGLMDACWISVNPYLLKIIIDRVSSNNKNLILNLTVPLVSFILLQFLFEGIWRLYDYFFQIKMTPSLRERILNDNIGKVLDQDYNFHQNNLSGVISHNLLKLSYLIPEIINTFLNRLLGFVLTLSIGLSMLGQVNIKFAVLIFVWIFFFFIILFKNNKTLIKQSDKWSEKHSKISGDIIDILSNILSIKLFSGKVKEKKRLHKTIKQSSIAEKEIQWTYLFIFLFIGFFYCIIQAISIFILIKEHQSGNISIGDFVLILSLNSGIVLMLGQSVREISHFSKMIGETQQALRTIYLPKKNKDDKGAKDLIVSYGDIILKNINFKYEDSKKNIFKNFSLKIPAKQKIGIVGYSGAGKSTLVKLILRLYDLAEGQILIDNQNIVNVTEESLRTKIGLITQNAILFNRTFEENILYGQPLATKKDLIEASKKAYCHNFISNTPKGYETIVGESGVKISEGEKQRIVIARVILKNAPILILDEATSQLDSITEKCIQGSLGYLMKDKTTIIIAHRLSTLLQMDRILVMDNGKIIENGEHYQLLKKKGLYYKLWNTQVNGFILKETSLTL